MNILKKRFLKVLYKTFRSFNVGSFFENILEESSVTLHLLSLPTFRLFNPLPDMPILGSSNSAANKDMMSKIWTNGDTIT